MTRRGKARRREAIETGWHIVMCAAPLLCASTRSRRLCNLATLAMAAGAGWHIAVGVQERRRLRWITAP